LKKNVCFSTQISLQKYFFIWRIFYFLWAVTAHPTATSESERELAVATRNRIASILDNWFIGSERRKTLVLEHFLTQNLLDTNLGKIQNEFDGATIFVASEQ
jgi:hypothetical protein